MPTYKNMYPVDLANGEARRVNIGTIYQGDSYANRIGAIVTENGLPVSLDGTCHGKVVQTIDGTTVLLENGVVDGNKAYCDLTPECYDSEGPVEIHIKWTNDTETAELLFASGYLKKTETDEVVDPSGRITISVETLINDIAEAEATIPEDYSILSNHVDAITHIDLTESGYVNGSGAEVANSDYRRTGYIPIASDSFLVLDGFFVGSTSGSAYAYYFYTSDKTPISGANGITTKTVVSVIPQTAAYVRFSSRISNGENPVAYVSNHVVQDILDLKDRTEVVEDDVADLKSAVEFLENGISAKIVKIPLGMEVGGFNESGRPISSTTRARAKYPIPVDMACPTIVFPENTKHKIIYYDGYYSGAMQEMTDWSTALSEDLTFPTRAVNNSRYAFKVLVGYTDDRTITSDNLPIPYIRYTTDVNNGTKYVNGYYPFTNTTPLGYIASYNASAYNLSAIIPVKPNTKYRANKLRNTFLLDADLQTKRALVASDITNNEIITNADEYYVVYCWKTTDTQISFFEEAAGYVSGARISNLVPNPLTGKRLSLLGDSISAYTGTIPSGNDVYYTGSNSGMDSPSQMWWSVLCDKLGMIPLVINGYSGSAVTQLEDSAHVSKVPMSSDDRCAALDDGTNDPDVIIIAGGVNDYTYAQSAQSEPLAWDGKTAPTLGNSFTEAYACMIKKLQTNYPNAIIVCLSTWFTMRGDDNGYTLTHTVGNNVYTQQDYNDKIRYVAEQMHVIYLNVSNIGFNRNNFYPTYAQDSSTIPTHPNYMGHRVMGMAIADRLPDLVSAYLKA